MHIVLGHVRQLEVDDVRKLVDIEPARRDVGRDQYADITLLEAGERTRARTLALVAVDRGSREAILLELFCEAVRTMLGAREDQHLAPVVRTDEVAEQFPLAALVDRVDNLVDALCRGVAFCDLDQFRMVQQPVRQILDLFREGRREEQVLTVHVGRQQGQHLADIVDEAHVEHAVCFVQYQDLDLREVDCLLGGMVQQSSGRCDENIDATFQLGDLRIDLDAAENHGGCHRQVAAIGLDALTDLGGQFAGRRQNQRAHGPVSLAGGFLRETLQQG